MKILLWGDGHISARRPGKRTDTDYFAVVLSKIREILSIAKQHECDAILQAGDLFDSPDVGHGTVSQVLRVLRHSDIPLHGIWGQHDVTGHSASTVYRSPLMELDAAGAWTMLDTDPTMFKRSQAVDIYGSSFGESIPEVQHADHFNILVTHRMIGDKPLWPGHDLTKPQGFMRAHPEFSLVFVGDYHYRFIEEYKGRIMVNSGCMMRLTVAERDMYQVPAVVVFDTVTMEYEIVVLTSAPNADDVFDDSVQELTDNAKLMTFIERLKSQQSSSIGWRHILLRVFGERNTHKRVVNIINDCLAEAKNGTDR